MRAAPHSLSASLAAPVSALMRHPRFGAAPIRASAWPRPHEDEAATEQTIHQMQEFIAADSQHPNVQAAAREATAGVMAGDVANHIRAVWAWIKRRVRLVSDAELARLGGFPNAEEAEVLIRPADILTMPEPQGDCDDFAMLGAAMLRVLGISSEFITVAADPTDLTRYSHVYLLAVLPSGERLPLDLSHGEYPGWFPGTLGKTRIWVSPQRGLGAIDWGALVQIGAEAGSKIATARYAQPPTGTYIQTGPSGQVIYRQPEGSATGFQFPTTQITGNWMTIAAIVALALVLILSLRGR